MEQQKIDPREIKPPHEVDSAARAEGLVASLRSGWAGRALLVEEIDPWIRKHYFMSESYQAWVGSHRIAAALELGLKCIPCEVITVGEAKKARRKLRELGFETSGYKSLCDTALGQVGATHYDQLEALELVGGLRRARELLVLEIQAGHMAADR